MPLGLFRLSPLTLDGTVRGLLMCVALTYVGVAGPLKAQGPTTLPTAKPSFLPTASELFRGTADRRIEQAQIRKLVGQLASPEAAERDAARRELLAAGRASTTALLEGLNSDDKTLARAAQELIDELPEAVLWFRDAAGENIGHVRVEFFQFAPHSTQLRNVPFAVRSTDSSGGFALPKLPERQGIGLRVLHRSLGATVTRLNAGQVAMLARGTSFSFRHVYLPVVPDDFEFVERGIEGVVQSQAGRPIAGAEVFCRNVAPQGGSHFSGITPRSSIVTGKDGRFRMYTPRLQQTEFPQRFVQPDTDPIPKNSQFTLKVRVPYDLAWCPTEISVANTSDAVVQLSRSTRRHRLVFQDKNGEPILDDAVLKTLELRYQPTEPAASDVWVDIDSRIARFGGPVHPGRYWAAYYNRKGDRVSWQNLTVAEDSPETLTFRMHPPVVFRGRVIDATNGEPLAGAFVGGWSSSSQDSLSEVTDAAWALAEQLPDNPSLDDAALQPFRRCYGFQQIVRSGDDGRFELHQQPDARFYGVMAFARHKLTIRARTFGGERSTDIPDLPLFPAAKLRIAKTSRQSAQVGPFPQDLRNVSMHWSFPDDEQPEWLSLFRKQTARPMRRTIGRPYWWHFSEPQVLSVPAGVKFRLDFRNNSDARFIPRNRDTVVQFDEGEVVDFGELPFAATIQVRVQAVGPDGMPIAGVPIRRLLRRGDERVWAVAHLTDQRGLAEFNVPTDEEQSFRAAAPDFARSRDGRSFQEVIKVRIDDTPPDEPIQMRLTAEQVSILFDREAASDSPQPSDQ